MDCFKSGYSSKLIRIYRVNHFHVLVACKFGSIEFKAELSIGIWCHNAQYYHLANVLLSCREQKQNDFLR